VQAALADGWLNAPAPLPDDRRETLAHLLHKLAGTAAMFGEAELGEAASVLERALLAAASGDALTALSLALLAQAEALAPSDEARRAHG
jgi:HPt (histidine-containing phosphotransfer) domain-containing protein